MDPRLLDHYREELAHLREMGAEFARDFPKIASRLAMDGTEVADPYVERLLEGFAFLAARVQAKQEAEHPRLVSHLVESLHPGFDAPVPSMAVMRMSVDVSDPNLARGFRLPRGSAVISELPRGQDTRCEFRTAHALTLWPVEIVDVRCFARAVDPAWRAVPALHGAAGGLRVRLRVGGGQSWGALGLDRLAFHIAAPDDVAWRLHEAVLGTGLGTWVAGPPGTESLQWRDAGSLRPLGFGEEEALLPETLHRFSGHRLLQELAAMPQRFLFFEVTDLAHRLARVAGDTVELVLPFSRADASLEAVVDAGSLALHCVPAVNLFPRRLDRVPVGPDRWEHHVVPDRTRPMDFEVHHLLSVTGFGGGEGPQAFHPLYATHHDAPSDAPGFYTVRREPRVLSARQQSQGPRSAYIGDEVYVSLVDPRHAPYRDDLRQLSVTAAVTNRDLPTLLPRDAGAAPGSPPAWRLDTPGPVLRVDALRGPTRPLARHPVGDPGWRLVGLLTLNQWPWLDESPERAAATLRRLLALCGPPDDPAWRRQVDGVRRLEARSVVRRLPFDGPLSFGAGAELTLTVDELAFQGASAFALGAVLERWFARDAAINTFTQLRLDSLQRGRVAQWAPRVSEGRTP